MRAQVYEVGFPDQLFKAITHPSTYCAHAPWKRHRMRIFPPCSIFVWQAEELCRELK